MPSTNSSLSLGIGSDTVGGKQPLKKNFLNVKRFTSVAHRPRHLLGAPGKT